MSKLFSALRIGQLELSHRLVTPLHADVRLDVGDYAPRTTKGGLLIVESLPEDEANQDRWKQVTDAIHGAGGLAVRVLMPRAQRRRADDIEVDAAMDDIQRAARLARTVGFDGIELDGGDGSLPDRFLQPETNARTDGYGGESEGRMRFLLEAAYVIAEEYSSERVGVRLSPCSREGQLELFAEVMRAVSDREVAYIHLAKPKVPPDLQISLATCAERRAFRSDISCALIASDHCDLDVASSVVESRWADAVGFVQANEDPDFIARSLESYRRRQPLAWVDSLGDKAK